MKSRTNLTVPSLKATTSRYFKTSSNSKMGTGVIMLTFLLSLRKSAKSNYNIWTIKITLDSSMATVLCVGIACIHAHLCKYGYQEFGRLRCLNLHAGHLTAIPNKLSSLAFEIWPINAVYKKSSIAAYVYIPVGFQWTTARLSQKTIFFCKFWHKEDKRLMLATGNILIHFQQCRFGCNQIARIEAWGNANKKTESARKEY